MTMTRKILIALSLTTFASPAFADTAPRLAIGGVDIVAYLAKGKPVPGTLENQTVWRDARWQFANKEDLDLFVANPEKLRPTMMCMGHTRTTTSVQRSLQADPPNLAQPFG